MALTADFHLHSSFSGDSDASMDEMIQKAISLGLTHMCFTEHYDPDFVYPKGESGTFELNTDSYLYDILRFREKYYGQIQIMFGVELGLQPHLKDELEFYTNTHDFDFIIGSSHICNRKDPYYPSFFEGRTEDEAHQEYFESILECVKTAPYFDVYGHLDYVVRYGPTKNANYTYQKHADIIDKILQAILDEGKGIELNTSGFRSGLNQPNPCIDIIRRYRELGGEIITIGSDAHEVAHVGADFDKAASILKDCGFKYYSVFEKRAPHFIKL